jgi:hypothetical protein
VGVSDRDVDVPLGPVGRGAKKAATEPLVSFGGDDDDLLAQGWRCVGVDARGNKIMAPPARYSIWFRLGSR